MRMMTPTGSLIWLLQLVVSFGLLPVTAISFKMIMMTPIGSAKENEFVGGRIVKRLRVPPSPPLAASRCRARRPPH